jgi:hypothetical protein
VFFIASTGRTGTLGLTRGLDAFSDHEVAHEPEPLLREAWLKHRGCPFDGPVLRDRLAAYARRHAAGERYGESMRTPNLLPELLAAAPGAPLLVIVRAPEDYVLSAFERGVLRKDDEWDRYRLLPEDDDPEEPVAIRLARHWCTVNRYLLRAVEGYERAAVALHQPLETVVETWAGFLGVTITDAAGLAGYLATQPNQALTREEPEGLEQVAPLCREVREEARDLARRRAPCPTGGPGPQPASAP